MNHKKYTKQKYSKNLRLIGKFFGAIFFTVVLATWALSPNVPKNTQNLDPINFIYSNHNEQAYLENCVNLFHKIRNNHLVYRPPVKEPPHSMRNSFDLNGKMPIREYNYSDNFSLNKTYSKSDIPQIISDKELSLLRDFIQDTTSLDHGQAIVQQQMSLYAQVKNSSLLVFGSEKPWVEVIAESLGANKIYTLDYARKKYLNEKYEWWFINEYLEYAEKYRFVNYIDISVSYSTIDHMGLGSYGDPLSPNGDLEAMQMIHCMLKPKGIFFVGLPVSADRKGYIQFNTGRVYGDDRLRELFDGWKVIGGKRSSDDLHTLYILQKI